MEIIVIGQRFKIGLLVEVDVDGVDNEIKLFCQCFQCLWIAVIYYFIGIYCQYFLFFCWIRIKGCYFVFYCVQKFYSDMFQFVNINYFNAVGSSDMVY